MPYYACGVLDRYTFNYCQETIYVPHGGDPTSAMCELHEDLYVDFDDEFHDEFQSDGGKLMDDINVKIRGECRTVISSVQFSGRHIHHS